MKTVPKFQYTSFFLVFLTPTPYECLSVQSAISSRKQSLTPLARAYLEATLEVKTSGECPYSLFNNKMVMKKLINFSYFLFFLLVSYKGFYINYNKKCIFRIE